MLEYVIFQNITSFVFLIFIIWIATFHLKTASFYLNNPLWASLYQNMLKFVLCEFNVNKVWNLLSYVLIMILTAGLYVILWCVIFPNHFPTACWPFDFRPTLSNLVYTWNNISIRFLYKPKPYEYELKRFAWANILWGHVLANVLRLFLIVYSRNSDLIDPCIYFWSLHLSLHYFHLGANFILISFIYFIRKASSRFYIY